MTTAGSPSTSAATATARNGSSSVGTSISADRPAARRAIAGRSARSGLDARTRPSRSSTCTSRSSSGAMTSAPGAVPASSCVATSSARTRVVRRTPSVRVCRIDATSVSAPAASATATTPTATNVVRTLTVPSRLTSPAVRVQAIARTPDRLDRLPIEGSVELVSEVADVDLDDVRVAVEVRVPHVLEHVALGDDLTRSPHQELEERLLAGRELDLRGAPPHPPARGIETQIAGRQHRGSGLGPAPDQRPQPRDENGIREGLGEVVVRARVERLDLVPLAVLRGEHEDRRPDALAPQGAAHPVAVDARQHDVEHDGVVRVLAGQPQAVGAVVGHVDREPFGLQTEAQAGRQPRFVLHHENPHDRPDLSVSAKSWRTATERGLNRLV